MKNYKESYDRWKKKKVLKKVLVFNPSDKKDFELVGKEKYPFDASYDSFDSQEVVRITYKPDVTKTIRPTIDVRLPFKVKDLSEYNRVRLNVYVKAQGFHNLYMHFGLPINDKDTVHAPGLKVNEWEDILWEVNHLDRTNVAYLTVIPFIGGRPAEAENEITVYISKVFFEKVESEYELGYEIGDRIAYSQLGYFTNSKKEFIYQKSNVPFEIYKGKEKVFEGLTTEESSSIGTFGVGDFSDVTSKGKYKIKIEDKVTPLFEISDNPYDEGIKASLYFLYQLRCGETVHGVHSACHLSSRTVNERGDEVPNFGGWHDAGDLSQFEIPTAEITGSLYDLYASLGGDERVLEEARVGSDWLLRTTFHDGSRALAISYDKWFDNIRLNDGHYPNNVAENGPFENFLSSNALALASLSYEVYDETYSNYCLKVAKEDFEFASTGYKEGKYTRRWGPSIVSQTLGMAVLAACNLFRATLDTKYLDIASEYANEVIKCQEKEYVPGSKIRGFFYEDPEHKYILAYEHRGHEEYVITGLVELCKLNYKHKDFPKWQEALELYREYILSTISATSPYYFLPGHIYMLDKINIEHYTTPASYGTKEEAIINLQNQIKEGVKINDNTYLRRMPIAIQRRGFHATLLSKTKAVSSIAKYFDDEKLRQIAIYQLEWVHGRNPFASSTMYKVGYNYHPLYVAYSLQMPGSLPVGIRTYKDSDKPYWPTFDNAVFKEIWGHTTGKYLSVIADLL